MIAALAVALLALLGALAVFGLATTVLGRPAGRGQTLAVRGVEVLLVVQAAIGLVLVLGGTKPAETSTFVIYLLVSVCVLPLGLQFATAEETRWGGAVIAVAALAVGVAVLRLLSLWAGAAA